MGSEEDDQRDENVPYYQYFMTVDVDLVHVAAVMFVRFLYYKVILSPHSPTVPFGRKSLCAAHT